MGEMSGKRRVRISALIGTFLLAAPLVWFFAHPELCHNIYILEDGTQVSRLATVKCAMMVLLAAAGLAAVWVPCPKLSERTQKVVGILGFLVTSVVMVFALEYANIRKHRMPLKVLQALGKKKLLLTWIVVILFASWFAVLVNRWEMASVLTASVVCAFGITCYFVYALRGAPLLASDFTTLQTAANVAGGYEYRIDSYTLTLLMFTISWSYIVLWPGKTKIFSRWSMRGIALAVMIALTILFDRFYIHSDLLRNSHVAVNTFRPEKSYGSHGAILTFIRSLQLMAVEEPDGYSVEKVEEIESRYMGVSGDAKTESENEDLPRDTMTEPETADSSDIAMTESGVKASSGEYRRPNVIIVMDEAFSDMQAWMDFETDKEVCPFFSNLTDNTIRGKFYVSSYGGRTANTEYEVLTGDSMGFLPPSSTPYQLYIKESLPNMDSALENGGYRHTVGMHPYLPSGYNRRNVYEMFGFDHLLFLDEFIAEDPNVEMIAGKVSDSADVDRIISEYEKAKTESDAPFFVYNVTMQNHSPYLGAAEDIGDPVHVTSGDGPGAYPDADVYLTLIRKSDQALEKLVDYFSKTDDPTVIVFFGDHQPNLGDPFYQMAYGKTMEQMDGEELMQFYHSNYIIWANFDIEEKEMDLSSNYLGPVLKQASGMELTGYDRFLLDLHEDLPIVSLNGYWDKDGVYYEQLEDKSSPWYDRLQEYDMLVYNHLFDEKNRADGFFGGAVQKAS